MDLDFDRRGHNNCIASVTPSPEPFMDCDAIMIDYTETAVSPWQWLKLRRVDREWEFPITDGGVARPLPRCWLCGIIISYLKCAPVNSMTLTMSGLALERPRSVSFPCTLGWIGNDVSITWNKVTATKRILFSW